MSLLSFMLVAILQVVPIPDNGDEMVFTMNNLYHFEDKDRNHTFEQISNTSFKKFKKNPDFQPNNYEINSAYWVKLSLDIPEGEKKYLIEFYDQTIDSLDLYIRAPDGSLRSIFLGDARSFSDKPIRHKNFEVLLNDAGIHTCYFRIASYHYADVRIAVRSINHFVYYALTEYFIYGIFYGMIIIISIYNLLIYGAIRELKYLYYTFYILSVGLYAMCIDGIAFQYLWPFWPEWNQIAYGVALFLVIFWSVVFSKAFLKTSTRAPRLNMVLNIVLLSRVLLFLYAFIWNNSFFQYRNIEIVPLTVTFYASIVVLKGGYKPARFFIVAYGFLFLGFLVKALLMTSSVPFSLPHIYYTLHYSFVFEMIFLTFALSDRVRILKSNRDKALKRTILQQKENMKLKDKVNRELESKVKERTKEIAEKNELLELTNEKIMKQSEEIGQINSMLDLDNWKLRNNIRDIQKERLMNKRLTYEEFTEVFKDGAACMKFLANYKWSDGYHCLKCGNEKHFTGQGLFARRCTRCGYNETSTTNTIFHATKFPIEKAFYLLYNTINDDGSSLDLLAEKLQVRRNTVWNFKKKITNRLIESPEELKNFFLILESDHHKV